MPLPKLSEFQVSIKLPFMADISGTWVPNNAEKKAAWEMYVQLVTRVTVVELGPDEGLLSEALASLYKMFDITRTILTSYGPEVAQPKLGGDLSFGQLAIAILNGALRPLLSKWHPSLADWESKRPSDVSSLEWEKSWQPQYVELRKELATTRVSLSEYAALLADVAGVASLTG